MSITPGDVYKEFVEVGMEWADRHAAATLLEDMIKPIRAQEALNAKHEISCSMAEATEIAYSSDIYRDALAEAAEARRLANRARVKYSATQALWEARRTAEASERAAVRTAT